MPTFYIVHKDTREVKRESSTPFNVDESVQPPAPYVQLKRVENDVRPTYNAATQKLVRFFTDNDQSGTRTFSWQVQAMTPAEVAAYNQRQTDAATLVQIKAVYNDLKNGTGTAAERITRLEKATAFILKQLYGNGS